MADAEQATKEAVVSHLTPIYRFVRTRVPADAVDDVVQEVFAAAANNVAQIDPSRGTLWQWLIGIARRQIGEHYPKLKKRRL